MQLSEAQTAYLAFLKAGGHKVAYMVGDAGFSELYIVTYGKGSAFYAHTLVDKGCDPVVIDHFDTMAEAIAFVTNQAIHTYLFCIEEQAPMQPFKECHRSKSEAELGLAVGNRLIFSNTPRQSED